MSALGQALPAVDVAPRRTKVLHALADHTDVDAFVITNLVNVRWLTGFTGSAGFVIATPQRLVLITDGRYEGHAHAELEAVGCDAEIIITTYEQKERAAEIIGGARRVGLEAEYLSWAKYRSFRDTWFPEARLAATTGIVDHLRRSKDAAEVARIERAAAITDAALASVRSRLNASITEATFAFELETAMRRLGASGAAFDTIVASGPNGALPHHNPSDRVISSGDLVVVDCGAMVDGYRSDMTRTFIVGTPSPTQQRMFEVVLEAQEAGVQLVGDGVPSADVDAACRAVIGDAGWANAFNHGTGHGVGLDIHELPRIGAKATDVLTIDDVITVEPGVYLPEHGGVRVEDTVLITDSGARRLTLTPKTLEV